MDSSTAAATRPSDIAGIKVIDADTHLTEPHELWTSRAPRGFRDRVPLVKDVEGVATWMFGDTVMGRAGARTKE